MTETDTFRCLHCSQRHPTGTLYCPVNGLPIEQSDTVPILPNLPEIRKLNRWWLIGGAVLAGAILCLAGIVTLSILRARVNPNITPTVLVFLPSQANNTPAPNITLVAPTP